MSAMRLSTATMAAAKESERAITGATGKRAHPLRQRWVLAAAACHYAAGIQEQAGAAEAPIAGRAGECGSGTSSPRRGRRGDRRGDQQSADQRDLAYFTCLSVYDQHRLGSVRSCCNGFEARDASGHLIGTYATARAALDASGGKPAPLILRENGATKGVLERTAQQYLVPIGATNGQSGGFLVNEVVGGLAS